MNFLTLNFLNKWNDSSNRLPRDIDTKTTERFEFQEIVDRQG